MPGYPCCCVEGCQVCRDGTRKWFMGVTLVGASGGLDDCGCGDFLDGLEFELPRASADNVCKWGPVTFELACADEPRHIITFEWTVTAAEGFSEWFLNVDLRMRNHGIDGYNPSVLYNASRNWDATVLKSVPPPDDKINCTLTEDIPYTGGSGTSPCTDITFGTTVDVRGYN